MPEACKASSIFPKSFFTATSCSPTGLSKATSLVLLRLEFQGNKLRPGPMRLLCGSTYRQNRALLTICAHHESLCSCRNNLLVVLRWKIVNQCTRFLLYISTSNIGLSEPPCTREAANQRAANFAGKINPHFLIFPSVIRNAQFRNLSCSLNAMLRPVHTWQGRSGLWDEIWRFAGAR